MAGNLRVLGVTVTETDDGMDITGVDRLAGGTVDSCGDHRIAMSLSVAALVAAGEITINDVDCVATSFPNFFQLLEKAAGK
jgi:3-phosphoshikimate 1-carboxyvinyltransferase